MFESPRVFFSCWWRCRCSKASLTLIFDSNASSPLFVMFSVTKSAICSRLEASMSSITVPVKRRFLSSKRECSDRVATWGFDQRFPPSSTSSSNFTQRAVSFHSISSPSLTSSSISENNGCDSRGGWLIPSSPFVSSPRINCTRCAGGVTENCKEETGLLIYNHVWALFALLRKFYFFLKQNVSSSSFWSQ